MTFNRLVLCFLWLMYFPFGATSQDSEALENDIAKAYCDSLTANEPKEFNEDKYQRLESIWDSKILKIKRQEFASYLSLQGCSRPKNGFLHDSTLYPIAYKMISGCDFYMSFLSKGPTIANAKPSLKKAANEICACVELEAKSYTILEMVGFENKALLNIFHECFKQSFNANKEVLVKENEITDDASSGRFVSNVYGYMQAHCRMFIHMLAKDKARDLAKVLSYNTREEYNRAGWNLAKAIKEEISDTLRNQFMDESSFKRAKPVLEEARKLCKANPSAFLVASGTEEVGNKTVHIFDCIVYPKLLFLLKVEYATDAYGKVKAISLVPRKEIKNLEQLEKDLPPPPPPLPPAPPPLPPPPPPPSSPPAPKN